MTRYAIGLVCATLLSTAGSLFAQTPPATLPADDAAAVRVVLVGDSTVCEYPAEKPERGWGHFIEERFTPGTVKVINLAASGRSTKTFISEGRWQKALDAKPDFVLIQFGHNDSHSMEKPEATDPATDFRANIRRYIADTRAAGATPVLVTPMVRRSFEKDGKLTEEVNPPGHSLFLYAAAMQEIGRELNVAVIDLHTSSWALTEKLGPQSSMELANNSGDKTHFNEKGARAMADLVMKELPTAIPQLAKDLKTP